MSISDIEKAFEKSMFQIYTRAKNEAGYQSSIFLRMLDDRGGLSTAKYLINASQPSDGYTKLWDLGRLDLTVEALVVENSNWHQLFETIEIQKAKKRLTDYGYSFASART